MKASDDPALTAERVRELLDYEPETGRFAWRLHRGGGAPRTGSRAGSYEPAHAGGQRYVRIGVAGKYHLAHRLAWLHVYGSWPRHEIDHVNGQCDDNRIANLRDVEKGVNQQNVRAARSSSSSGVLGAHRIGDKWQARITVNGNRRFLGVFGTPQEAGEAYLSAKRRLHAGCTL